jgi:hypothetical protein
MTEYFKEGFPGVPYSNYHGRKRSSHNVTRNATFYGKVIIRDLRNPRADDVGRFLWQAFLKGAKRDQIWLPYAIWKAGAQVHDFGILPSAEYEKVLGKGTGWHGHRLYSRKSLQNASFLKGFLERWFPRPLIFEH